MSFVRASSLLTAALVCIFFSTPVQAETLRVGKAVPESFAFLPLDIGMHEGIYKRNGIDIDEIAFAGDAKLQQAMAADSLDIALLSSDKDRLHCCTADLDNAAVSLLDSSRHFPWARSGTHLA